MRHKWLAIALTVCTLLALTTPVLASPPSPDGPGTPRSAQPTLGPELPYSAGAPPAADSSMK